MNLTEPVGLLEEGLPNVASAADDDDDSPGRPSRVAVANCKLNLSFGRRRSPTQAWLDPGR